MQTTLKELPDSRVEVQAEVAAEDVQKAANRTARAMAREMRLPGFRKGKAPPNLVIQRMGFPAVLSEAIREALPEFAGFVTHRAGRIVKQFFGVPRDAFQVGYNLIWMFCICGHILVLSQVGLFRFFKVARFRISFHTNMLPSRKVFRFALFVNPFS